jgi:hypothetical protein
MVVPVLDGLDEMDDAETPEYSSRAAQAIRACNRYLDAGQKGAMVLTCRINQYEALEQAREWVRDAARIELRPVEVAAARGFLTRRVDDEERWQPVLGQMQRSGGQPLAEALATPWRLTLAATVYEQRDAATGAYVRDPAELTAPGLDAEDKIRDHLLGLYIPAVIAAHPGRYSASKVHRWLSVLSGYLDSNTPTPDRPARVIAGRTLSGADLVPHELWPLAGSRAPRVISVAIVTMLSAGLAALMLSQVPVEVTTRRSLGAGSAVLPAIIGIAYTWVAWPPVTAFNTRLLKTRKIRSWLAWGVAIGLLGGFTLWRLTSLGLTAIPITLVIGVALALLSGFSNDPDEYSVADPRQTLKSIRMTGLLSGLAVGSAVGLAFGLTSGPGAGLAFGLAFAFAFGPFGTFWEGFPVLRFIVLLLCTRRWNHRWLPWRLEDFLNWCYQAGLIRVAGIGYQLRHRELQDYLAGNLTLPRPDSRPETILSPPVADST